MVKFKDIGYLFILSVAIILSLSYGQILEANVGSFPDFMVFGSRIPLRAIIICPILITCIYVYGFFIAYKNNLIEKSKNSLIFMSILGILLVYMVILIATKDNSHLYNPDFKNAEGYVDPATTYDRIFSIFTFYLEILIIYTFYFLFKATKHYKEYFGFLFIAIAIYGAIAIIYSLFSDFESYKVILFDGKLFEKNYDHIIRSFYAIGNVFGHTLHVSILALVFAGYLLNRKWICFLSLLYTPFVLLSGSRASIMATFLFYFVYSIYLIYATFKKSLKRGIIYTSCWALISLYCILEFFVFKVITFTFHGETYHLEDLFKLFNGTMDSDRLSIIRTVYSKATFVDIFYGLGYGNQFIPTRTYGFIYYFHNTYVEYLAIGGVPYCLFILGIIIKAFIDCLKCFKQKPYILGIFVSILVSQAFYGMFESIPVFNSEFFGVVFAIFIVLMPKLAKEEVVCGEVEIKTLKVFKLEYKLNFIDPNEEKDPIKSEKIKNLILERMKKECILSLKVELVNAEKERELEKDLLTSSDLERKYKSIYSKKENKYYVFGARIK